MTLLTLVIKCQYHELVCVFKLNCFTQYFHDLEIASSILQCYSTVLKLNTSVRKHTFSQHNCVCDISAFSECLCFVMFLCRAGTVRRHLHCVKMAVYCLKLCYVCPLSVSSISLIYPPTYEACTTITQSQHCCGSIRWHSCTTCIEWYG
jgi:hypothetical protein